MSDRFVHRARGRSAAPLVLPGDDVLFEPCALSVLRRGDLVLVERDGVRSVRVLTSRTPLRTALLRGAAEDEPGTVLARVAEVRRHGRARGRARLLLHTLAFRVLRGSALAQSVWRLPDHLLTLRAVRAYHAWRTGPVHVRLLTRADADAIATFTRKFLPDMHDYVTDQCATRWPESGFAAGAFDRRGRLAGFAFVDEYARENVRLAGWWLRALKVAPHARRRGIGRELSGLCYAEAQRRGIDVVNVDVFADNSAGIAVQRSLGLTDAPPSLIEDVNRIFGEPARVVLQSVTSRRSMIVE